MGVFANFPNIEPNIEGEIDWFQRKKRWGEGGGLRSGCRRSSGLQKSYLLEYPQFWPNTNNLVMLLLFGDLKYSLKNIEIFALTIALSFL